MHLRPSVTTCARAAVSATAVHALNERAIYDIEAGATLATLPRASVLAGGSVVYPCGNAICAAPY
ncbi:hypothetical protein [Sorangium sp. So ce233]|uniref:hypothetical protein n=1 Tax=Sorangium sp. So ce233 TaxID=3133290 RepID=UPI003F6466D4